MTTNIYWTQIKTDRRGGALWRDHLVSHRNVMSLFPALKGERVREAGDVLYRVNPRGEEGAEIFIQSSVPSDLSVAEKFGSVLAREANTGAFRVGDRVRYRVVYNPSMRYSAEVNGQRTARAGVHRMKDSIERFGQRVADAMIVDRDDDGLVLLDGTPRRERTYARTHTPERPNTMVTDRLMGRATVVDPVALARMCREGIGRGRAYGSGLLLVSEE